MAPGAQPPGYHGGMFQRFFHSEVSGSIVLLTCTIAALIWANSSWAEAYFALEHTMIGVYWGEDAAGLPAPLCNMSLGHWIGDGLMVIFFFVVGLEIKRELVVGQLSTLKKAILPVSAALGGMVAPAGIYLIFNYGTAASRGWGVPMATDIAFALGILALFGKRVPIGLKVFLTALAIADDLGAVLVIAVFYTEQIVWSGLGAAVVCMALIALCSKLGIRRIGFYVVFMIGVWAGVHVSGVHATVAGVLVALLVPVRAVIEPSDFLTRARQRLHELEQAELTRDSMLGDKRQLEALDDIYNVTEDMRPAGITLEQYLHPIQSFMILPLFALFKAGIPLDAEALKTLTNPITLGVVGGLVFGKQIGVLLFTWLPIRLGYADMPAGVTWAQLWGASCLAGVGFTMSIFVSELAFTDRVLVDEAKIGVIAASVIAGIVGFIVLWRVLPRKT